jgi:hypothetical protein
VIQVPFVPILSQLLLAQTVAEDETPWIPLTQWSDLPVGPVVKFVVLPLVVVAVVWAAVHIRTRREGTSYNSPRRLFNELCALHELDWPTRRLLRQLARSRHYEHPARIFVEPACFDLASIPPQLQSFRAELLRLKTRLF